MPELEPDPEEPDHWTERQSDVGDFYLLMIYKLLAEDDELYVYAESVDRVSKERAMRKRQLKWLWKRLRELAAMEIPREEMLMKLGAARARAPTAWRLVDIEMDKESAMFIYTLNRQKLRRIRRREGRYLLRTNLTENAIPRCWGNTIRSSLPSKRYSKI